MRTITTITYCICALSLFVFTNSKATTIRAIQSGNWESTSTWQFGVIPTNGDSVVILPNKEVRVTTMLNYTTGTAMQLNIFGTLTFQSGKKLFLPSGSIITIQNEGEITAGNGGGNSNTITIGNTLVWNAGNGPISGFLILPATPLPIEMQNFNASSKDKSKVVIAWETFAEINNAYFDVERSSDGKQYKFLGRVAGHGTNSNGFKYSFTDSDPIEGVNYYRLKQVDLDGKFVYTKPIAFNFSSPATSEMKIFPNPSKGEIFMDYPSFDGAIDVHVADTRGNIILEKQIQNVPGSRSTRITDQGTAFKPGVYFITLIIADEPMRKQVIVY